MSDEFDKEAEREKLREKLEKDEQKRQATREMSELLLQGATMTNEHCERCGDPLFRDDGETFCPTCGGADAETGEQATAQPQQQRQPATDTQPEGADEITNGAEHEGVQRPDERREATGVANESAAPQQRQPAGSTGNTDAGGPRAELQRAVMTTARKANESADPRTAKAWLEASKEAAEALEALER